MARFFALLTMTIALAVSPAAIAEMMSNDQYEQKLKTFDPQAVAAAQSYAKTFDMMGMFARSAPAMEQGLTKQLKAKNPDITDEQSKLFVDAFKTAALVDSADGINHAVILSLLDVMSKEELVALDQFYSTPTGRSIMAKFPTLSERLGNTRKLMTTDVIPHALDVAKAKLKERGVEVKM